MQRMKRRTFLQTSAAAGATTAIVTALPSSLFGAEHKLERIGLQLYTVRDLAKTDFGGTLAQVSKVGYKEVELAGLLDHSPKEVRAMLDRVGLAAPSGHVAYALVENKWPETLEAAHVIGQKYIVCPWIEEKQRKEPNGDGWKRAAELFNRAGEASQKAGLQFAYHQHTFEFEPISDLGGKLPYDLLLDSTDPKFVQFEMDLCWATVGGADPLKYFAKYPGRFPMVHVKDWKGHEGTFGDEKKYMTSVGDGSIDWKRLLAGAEQEGVKHYFVENDVPPSPIDNIRASYTYLSNLRF
jgi:sugar phosphate isomerase/epimerase